MPLELREVTSFSEFPEVIECEFLAHETPWNGILEIFCPTLGTGPTARENAVKEGTDRQWMWHKADPTSHWLKVIDTDAEGKVIAAARWHVYKEDPYSNSASQSIDAVWWPEGEGRKFANMSLGIMMEQKLKYTRKPHMCKCF